MLNQSQHPAERAETQQQLPLTLIINDHPYEVAVNPKEIFHEALEHALPQ